MLLFCLRWRLYFKRIIRSIRACCYYIDFQINTQQGYMANYPSVQWFLWWYIGMDFSIFLSKRSCICMRNKIFIFRLYFLWFREQRYFKITRIVQHSFVCIDLEMCSFFCYHFRHEIKRVNKKKGSWNLWRFAKIWMSEEQIR